MNYPNDYKYGDKPGVSRGLLWVGLSILLGTIAACTGIYFMFR